MTLNTPLIHSVSAFDPSYEHAFEFTYSGNQVFSNRAIITDNGTQAEVYNVLQEGQKWNHLLPANTLEPGHSYLIQIQVYDVDGNHSNLSDAVLFYCFTTPQFYFSNIENGDTVSSANLELNLSYEQPETEGLNEYKYCLYDMTRSLVYTSDSFYTEKDMTHTIYGLKNDYIYYVRAIGKTTHGMDVDTGFIQIAVHYIKVASNIAFEAINDSSTGCVILKTNIIGVDFNIENEDYVIENGVVDLTGNTLTYLVDVENDFYLALKPKQIPMGDFLWSTDGNISVSVESITDKYYAHLKVSGVGSGYNIYEELDANHVTNTGNDYLSSDNIAIQIYRKNNIYDLRISYE